MTYGIEIRDTNGSLSLTSRMPTYTLWGTRTSGPVIVPGGPSDPPLVFTRVASSSHPCAVIPVFTKYNGSAWEVGFGYYSGAIYPNSVKESVNSATIVAYIFVRQRTISPTGWGVVVYDEQGGGLSLSGEDKPLIIRRRLYIDDNTVSRRIATNYPPMHGRSVNVGTPQGKWAAAIGWDRVLPDGFYKLYNLGRWLTDSQGYGVAGVPAHIYINDSNNTITTQHGQWAGPEDPRDNQRSDFMPVMLIDTHWYDK